MNENQILGVMAQLFTDHPDRFTHGAEARNATNDAVPVDSPDAFSFSANGFMQRIVLEGAAEQSAVDRACEALASVARNQFSRNIASLNDVDGREAVIRAARSAMK